MNDEIEFKYFKEGKQRVENKRADMVDCICAELAQRAKDLGIECEWHDLKARFGTAISGLKVTL